MLPLMYFNKKVSMENIHLKVSPEYEGRYFEATEFNTVISLQTEQMTIKTVKTDTMKQTEVIKVSMIDLHVKKNDKKNIDHLNYQTKNSVTMKVNLSA